MSKQERLFENNSAANRNELNIHSQVFFKRFGLERAPRTLEDIHQAFTALKEGIRKGDLEASLIGKYVYEHVSKEEIRTRRVTARDFEEFLTTFFEGEIIEAEEREKYLKELLGRDDFSRRVSRNRLEKLDVRLGKVLLSVKTFVPQNKELNAGSFSAEALFAGFLPLPIPNERTDLGSQKALEEKFGQIEKAGKWKDFVGRFEKMINTIYLTDWVFTIKGGQYLDIYLLTGNKFRELMIGCVRGGPSMAVELLNRFEAHAIRTQLDPLLSESLHVKVNLIGPLTARLQRLDQLVNVIRSTAIAAIRGEIKIKEAIDKIQRLLQDFFKS